MHIVEIKYKTCFPQTDEHSKGFGGKESLGMETKRTNKAHNPICSSCGKEKMMTLLDDFHTLVSLNMSSKKKIHLEKEIHGVSCSLVPQGR
jgi:hypothetical protein